MLLHTRPRRPQQSRQAAAAGRPDGLPTFLAGDRRIGQLQASTSKLPAGSRSPGPPPHGCAGSRGVSETIPPGDHPQARIFRRVCWQRTTGHSRFISSGRKVRADRRFHQAKAGCRCRAWHRRRDVLQRRGGGGSGVTLAVRAEQRLVGLLAQAGRGVALAAGCVQADPTLPAVGCIRWGSNCCKVQLHNPHSIYPLLP